MTWIPWFAALAPIAYLAAALAPPSLLSTHRTTRAAGWLSLAVAGVTLVVALATGGATSPTLGIAGLGAAIRADPLSSVLSSLIGFIGLIVVAYSRNYLLGDPEQGRFTRGLCLTLGLLQALVLSGNLAQLIICWIGSSLCVNQLLLFRSGRQAAVLAARKRFVVSRLADTALIAAGLLLWRGAGSGDIGAILVAAKSAPGPDWALAAVLLALAAVFSTAQLPFHGWVLEVMETPTPVSALLHAGVVNAGGFLMLRFADVLSLHSAALGLLTAAGAASAIFGSLVMLTQTSVKVALAYSTIAQMGFMLLECGLGAYSAALLHIVAHALYKAHAFLAAGGAAAVPKRAVQGAAARPLAVLAAPALVALAALFMTGLGAGPSQQPGVFILSAIILLGLAKPWLERRDGPGLLAAAVMSALVIPAYVIGQAIFSRVLGDLGPHPAPTLLSFATSILIVGLMTGLVCLQLQAPGKAGSAAWARAYALVSSGFHLNTFANRWVLRLWPAAPSKSQFPGASA